MTTTKKINHGSVKLTRENITQGRLGEKIRSISGSDKVLSQDELINERRKIIPDDGIGEDIYIFAYGSLLWNPTVDYEEQFLAKVYGFHRSFCMKTNLGRGSFENPGLMLALDNGGSCRGSAFRLNRNDAIKNIDLELLKYEYSQGSHQFRKNLCLYYSSHNINVSPDDIITTVGASEALSFTMNSICDLSLIHI